MEDLAELQNKFLESIFENENCTIVEHEDIVAEATNQISNAANELRDLFAKMRHDKSLKIKDNWYVNEISKMIKWATTLFYTLEMEPPEIVDLMKFTNSFEAEIAADGILSTMQIQRSISDFALMSFVEEDPQPEELEMCAVEILCCAELLLRRINKSLTELIADL